MKTMMNPWESFFEMIQSKSYDSNFKEYLPLDKNRFVTGYELSDLNFAFTIAVDGDCISFNKEPLESSDICIRLDAPLLLEILTGRQDLFQVVVQNRLTVMGNSQYLTYLTSKNIILDIIKKHQLQQEVDHFVWKIMNKRGD